jgi:RNA polymerase II-associated factor 1
MFPEKPVPINPRDRALLKPLTTLGKFAADASTVSFLRRTEYITGREASTPGGNSILRSNNALRQKPRTPGASAAKPAAAATKNDALKNNRKAMLRGIEKSFNLAHPSDAYTGPDTASRVRGNDVTPAERTAWDRPVNPLNPSLRLLDSYQFIPDLAAIGDSGGYMLLKYNGHPTGESVDGAYDERIDHLLLRPAPQTPDQLAKFEADQEAHEHDPLARPAPLAVVNFEAYVPHVDALPSLKRKLDAYARDRDDPRLYTDVPDPENGDPHFRFKRLRDLETFKQTGDPDLHAKWNDSVAVALHDGEVPGAAFGDASGRPPRRQKAAYAYPITQKTSVRPTRTGMSKYGIKRGRDEGDWPDAFEVTVADMDREKIRDGLRSYDALLDDDEADGEGEEV